VGHGDIVVVSEPTFFGRRLVGYTHLRQLHVITDQPVVVTDLLSIASLVLRRLSSIYTKATITEPTQLGRQMSSSCFPAGKATERSEKAT
jgi:hypothetical protein